MNKIVMYLLGESMGSLMKGVDRKIDNAGDKLAKKICDKMDVAIDKLVVQQKSEPQKA